MSTQKDKSVAKANIQANAKQAHKSQNEGLAANSPLPPVSEADRKEAMVEGIKDDLKEVAKDAHRALTDGNLPGEVAPNQWPDSGEIMQFAHLIELPLDELKRATAKDAGYGVSDGKVAGLLELERSGKNRTDYVQYLCQRLGVKSPYEVTNAGPGYTNDTTNVTAL